MSEASEIEEMKRQIEFYKIDQRVTAQSSSFHIQRCRLLEQANEDSNALIGDISTELGALVKSEWKRGMRDACKIALDINDGHEWPVTRAITEAIQKRES